MPSAASCSRCIPNAPQLDEWIPALCCCRALPGSLFASWWVGVVVVLGRLLAAAVELWVVRRHLGGLLAEDVGGAGAAAGRRQSRAAVARGGATGSE